MSLDSKSVKFNIEDSQEYVQPNKIIRPTRNIVLGQFENRQESKENVYGSCSIFLLVILIIGIIGGATTYYVFSIMALSNTSNHYVKTLCSNSTLWVFLIVALIIVLLINTLSVKLYKKDNKCFNNSVTLLSMFVSIGFASWGGYEIWYSQCNIDNFADTQLFMMAKITVILNIITGGLRLLTFLYDFLCK